MLDDALHRLVTALDRATPVIGADGTPRPSTAPAPGAVSAGDLCGALSVAELRLACISRRLGGERASASPYLDYLRRTMAASAIPSGAPAPPPAAAASA